MRTNETSLRAAEERFHAAREMLRSARSSFGERMRAHRERRGVSLRAHARELNISPSYLSMLERGKRAWSKKLLRDISQ